MSSHVGRHMRSSGSESKFVCMPVLEKLEDRLPPGDAILGSLLIHTILTPPKGNQALVPWDCEDIQQLAPPSNVAASNLRTDAASKADQPQTPIVSLTHSLCPLSIFSEEVSQLQDWFSDATSLASEISELAPGFSQPSLSLASSSPLLSTDYHAPHQVSIGSHAPEQVAIHSPEELLQTAFVSDQATESHSLIALVNAAVSSSLMETQARNASGSSGVAQDKQVAPDATSRTAIPTPGSMNASAPLLLKKSFYSAEYLAPYEHVHGQSGFTAPQPSVSDTGRITPGGSDTPPVVPTQFIAKLYTEAFGRIPDQLGLQSGWAGWVSHFESQGCNSTSLATFVNAVYLGNEFTNIINYQYRPQPDQVLKSDYGAMLLTLYRGVLNDEPEPIRYQNDWNRLESGVITWPNKVSEVLATQEFANLLPAICSTTAPGTKGNSYGFGSNAPITGTGGYVAYDENALDAALVPYANVCLPPKTVVRLTRPLDIPEGATLRTCDSGNLYSPVSRNRYAHLARLYRAFGSGTIEDDVLIKVFSRSTLNLIWVDGSRNRIGDPIMPSGVRNNSSVVTAPGADNLIANIMISHNLITNSPAVTSLGLGGRDIPPPWPATQCQSTTAASNLITNYASTRANGHWTDGISVWCENALVENNEIVDPTDVGITLFDARGRVTACNTSPGDPDCLALNPVPPPGEPNGYRKVFAGDGLWDGVQRSLIRNNKILSAGNSAFAAMAADPRPNPWHSLPRSNDRPMYFFDGVTRATFESNEFWTGSNTSFTFGLTVGTRAWFGTFSAQGWGARFVRNTTGSTDSRVIVNTTSGIGVSGMNESVVGGSPHVTDNNNRTYQLFPSVNISCSLIALGKETAFSVGSFGNDYESAIPTTYTGCLSTPPPGTPPVNDALFVTQTVPTNMTVGRTYAVTVKMRNNRNTSTIYSTWTSSSNYRLGSRNQPNNLWGLDRVELPADVAPCQPLPPGQPPEHCDHVATFNFTVTAPSVPGMYSFRWQMLQENVEWFGDHTPAVAVNVQPEWTNWTGLGGPTFNLGTPVSYRHVSAAEFDVWATGADGKVWYRHYVHNGSVGTWGNWENLAFGTPIPNFPSGAPLTIRSLSAAEFDVWATGADGKVWYRHYVHNGSVGTWGNWENLAFGTPIPNFPSGAPVAVHVISASRFDVFAVGTDYELKHRRYWIW